MDGSFLRAAKIILSAHAKRQKCSKRQLGSLYIKNKTKQKKTQNLPLHQAIAFASGRNASQNFISWKKTKEKRTNWVKSCDKTFIF